uniref:U1-type domain-containing protein n=1 Tax=Ananas comosus var. bracteatus TaxID=296719 RepID=A0A6V7PW74_ANACO|nr:unnamed protein product [Ananas comosus var. bracteatus]
MAGGPEGQWHGQRHPHHPMVGGGNPYRGGGRRGRGPFRGGRGGRGNFGPHPPRQDAMGPSPPPGRGGGRGRRGRGRSSRGGGGRPSNPPGSLVTEPAPPRRPALPVAWCDVCRVDCNSLEILEQHKNGKRHKRTVQRIQEIQAQQKLMGNFGPVVIAQPELVPPVTAENSFAPPITAENSFVPPITAENSFVPPITAENSFAPQVGEVSEAPSQMGEGKEEYTVSDYMPLVQNKESAALQNTQAPAVGTENNPEDPMQTQAADGQTEPPKELGEKTEGAPSDAIQSEEFPKGRFQKRPRMDSYNRFNRRGGASRQPMRYWQTEKRMRFPEPPKPKREQPRVCTVCNVMCDTVAVFDIHLAGKKHIAKIKRFQGSNSVFGPIQVFIPPNQPTAYPPRGPQPIYYGMKTPEMIQQEAYMLSRAAQLEGYGVPQEARQSVEAAEGSGAAQQTQAEGENAAGTEGKENVQAVTESGLENATTEGGSSVAAGEDVAPFRSTALRLPEVLFLQDLMLKQRQALLTRKK